MTKNSLNILIVEDDATQGKALKEAFSRAGYNTTLSNSSVSALSLAQRTEFHGLIVDCMLPKMNGVDLAEEVRDLQVNKPKIFLISGIFKDKSFSADALARTGAEAFLLKPVDLQQLLHMADQALASMLSQEAPTALRLYTAEAMDGKDLIALINKESTVHAFHLPKIYQRIHDTDMTGELVVTSAGGGSCTVCFYHGKIFAVRVPDNESYFGSLAVSHGFVSPEEVLKALRDPSEKLLGQKLIDSLSLSPHAIQVVLEEQLALRLSQTVQNRVVTLQWANQQFPRPDFTLLQRRFNDLMEDWLGSKITPSWIRSTLMEWGPYEIEGTYHPQIQGNHSIEELFSDPQFKDQDVVKIGHALLIDDAQIGKRRERGPDFSFLESRLDRMTKDFKNLNYYEILGVTERSQQREVNRAYEGLKESFFPTNLPTGCPPELISKCEKVFSYIERAYETLANDIHRLRYQQALANKRAEEALAAEPIFRTAILEVQSGHAAQASKKFQNLIDRNLEFKDLRSYRIWAGLNCDRNFSEIRLDQVPPEERHSAPYMMAKGVSYRLRGLYKKSLEAFRTAHILDPRTTIAKYELRVLMEDVDRRTQNRELVREINNVLEGLFGKTRRSA